MRRLQRRYPIIFAILACAAAAIAIPVLAGAGDDTPAPAATPPGSGHPLAGNAELAGKVVKVSTTHYLNYDAGGRENSPDWMRQINDHTYTESWSKLDANGNILEYRNVTHDENGAMVQDQYYDGKVEHINWYSWLDTGMDCTTDSPRDKPMGGLMPVVSEGSRLSQGYGETVIPAEAAQFADGVDVHAYDRLRAHERPGFPNDREVMVLQDRTNYLLGWYVYGVNPAGGQRLLEATWQVVKPTTLADLPAIKWEELSDCSHPPSDRPTTG